MERPLKIIVSVTIFQFQIGEQLDLLLDFRLTTLSQSIHVQCEKHQQLQIFSGVLYMLSLLLEEPQMLQLCSAVPLRTSATTSGIFHTICTLTDTR